MAKQYYFHRFYSFQPDLNTANPEVQAEILRIMGFWLQLGVSGFRMDAVPFVIAKKGTGAATKPQEQYDMLRMLSMFLNWRDGDAIILAEANVLPDTDMQYFGKSGDRLQMMFNFEVNQHLFLAMASSDSTPLIEAMNATRQRPDNAQWGQFLRNHDELDLGRLTKTERQTVFNAFGPDLKYATVSAGNPAASCADAAWRPTPVGTCIQPHVDATGHTRPSLWR